MRNLIAALVDYTIALKDFYRESNDGEDLEMLWGQVARWARPQGLTPEQALRAYLRR